MKTRDILNRAVGKETATATPADFQLLFLRNPLGPKVLMQILEDLGYFSVSDDETYLLNNYAKFLLGSRLGLLPADAYAFAEGLQAMAGIRGEPRK